MPGPAQPSPLVRRAALVAAAGLLVAHAAAAARSEERAPETPALPRVASPPRTTLLAETARDPRWRALLQRARRRPDAKTRASLHDAGFLLVRDGRDEEELAATWPAFEDVDPVRAQAARCRFPARHHFLAAAGLVSSLRGPCPELDAWRAEIGDFALTLVFPESFLGNPASMFGHTLLRFDPIRATGRTAPHAGDDPASANDRPSDDLLGWALDYTADARGEVGALYLTRGLIGGYRGRFSLDAYYQKTLVYSDWQDRDIWEYPLALDAERRERLLLHVWELRDVALPYYFFTENCSEKILELLEVAWPGLGRGGGMPPMVAPVDTVRAIAQAPGDPLGVPRLRESPATRLQRVVARMPGPDAELAEALALGRTPLDDAALAARPDAARARILEVAYDLLRHRYLAGDVDDASSRGRSRALLLARSRIARADPAAEAADAIEATETAETAEASAAPAPIDKRPPDRGHGTARVELAGGRQDRDGFVELRIQPAYHELLDAGAGFAEGGQIRALDTRVRWYPALDRVRLHELVLLDVATASPWRRPFRPLGWRVDLGLRTRLLSSDRDRGLDTEGVFRIQGGIGAAVSPFRGALLYGFGELALEAAPGLEGDVAGGPVTRSGMTFATPGQRASIQLEAIAGLLAGEATAPWLRIELAQRTQLSRHWALVVSGRWEQAYSVDFPEARIGLTRYF